MRTINNWGAITPAQMGDRAKLPADAYVCRIKSATVETITTQSGSFEKLVLMYDIEEGEWAGYYTDLWRSNTAADKKWKGTFRQTIPLDNGTDQDEKTKRYFKGAITAIEESNPGYTFNFDEKTLVGKLVGVMYREEEYDFNGYHGMAAKPFFLMDIHRIANGDYTIPKPKMMEAPQAPSYHSAPYNPYIPQAAPAQAPAPVQVPSYIPMGAVPTGGFEEIKGDDDLPF